MKVQTHETNIDEVKIIKVKKFQDDRGFFAETFHTAEFEKLGLPTGFVQDNHSASVKNVLRGFHYQDMNSPQIKLVRCTMGEILDVAVDLRKGSPSYGQCVSQVLSADNMLQMLVPIGFGHAFLTLSDYAEVQYKCSDYYAPDSEGNILWNDPDISFDWPVNDPILSKRDAAAQTFREYDQHPAFHYPQNVDNQVVS